MPIALYVVHHPDGRRLPITRPMRALTLALLLSVVHGAPVRVDVGRHAPTLSDPPGTLDARSRRR